MRKDHSYKRESAFAAGPGRNRTEELLYLLVGGGIGAVLALLFAPKRGAELRSDIADATRRGLDATKNAPRALKEQSSSYAQSVREKADAVLDFASRSVSSEGGNVSDPFSSAVTGKRTAEGIGNESDIGDANEPGRTLKKTNIV